MMPSMICSRPHCKLQIIDMIPGSKVCTSVTRHHNLYPTIQIQYGTTFIIVDILWCWPCYRFYYQYHQTNSIWVILAAIGNRHRNLKGLPWPCFAHIVSSKDGRHGNRTREAHETEAVKAERFETASTRKMRKLSGWNVFCRSRMEGESCNLEEYSNRVKRLANEWKTLSADEKSVFEVEAQHQEVLRSQLAFTPLSTGKAAKGNTVLEAQVGRKACKRLSARRLRINDDQFAKHPMWSLPTCFCDSNLKPFSVGKFVGL